MLSGKISLTSDKEMLRYFYEMVTGWNFSEKGQANRMADKPARPVTLDRV